LLRRADLFRFTWPHNHLGEGTNSNNWRSENIFKYLSEELKGGVYKALVLPTSLYGCEAWSLREDNSSASKF